MFSLLDQLEKISTERKNLQQTYAENQVMFTFNFFSGINFSVFRTDSRLKRRIELNEESNFQYFPARAEDYTLNFPYKIQKNIK